LGFWNSNGRQDLEAAFFHDGRDGDIRSLWSFGVNGFFVPPPDFAGLPFLSTNGTIIPTAAVGVICFDGLGGCSLELTAVVGGNLGRQVFNVSLNKIRLISSICRVRVSRLGRVVVTAKLAEVSSRLMPTAALSVPIVIIAQLASRSFGYIEFDQLFVMQGQLTRIRRFDFLNNNNQGGKHTGQNVPVSGGPGFGGPGAGNMWGDVMGGNNNNNNGNDRFGVCPNLLDDAQSSDYNGDDVYGSGRKGNYGAGGYNPNQDMYDY